MKCRVNGDAAFCVSVRVRCFRNRPCEDMFGKRYNRMGFAVSDTGWTMADGEDGASFVCLYMKC